jgi:hypothetical protein
MNTQETLNAWVIYRLMPNLQRLPVAQFRSRKDAESSLKIIRQMLPDTELILAFEVSTEHLNSDSTQPPAKKQNLPASANREVLKIILISSRPVINRTIHSLHHNNFAQVSDWSPIVPTQNPGEAISILVKYFAVTGNGQ